MIEEIFVSKVLDARNQGPAVPQNSRDGAGTYPLRTGHANPKWELCVLHDWNFGLRKVRSYDKSSYGAQQRQQRATMRELVADGMLAVVHARISNLVQPLRDESVGIMAMRLNRDEWEVLPASASGSAFHIAVSALQVGAALRLESPVITGITTACVGMDEFPDSVPIEAGVYVQIVPHMADLAKARRSQGCAFIASENCLIVWADDVLLLPSVAQQMSKTLLNFIWAGGDSLVQKAAIRESLILSKEILEKNATVINVSEASSLRDNEGSDLEKGMEKSSLRQQNFMHSVCTSLGLIILMYFQGSYIKALLSESLYDRTYIRFALVIFLPFFAFVSMFFANMVVSNLLALLGPVSQTFVNSRYYSGAKPVFKNNGSPLPHMTIQCPVYKESLEGVIDPTIQSLRRAIRTYELQGGTAAIFVNDDGMRLLDVDSQRMRQQYYADNDIGWVARPPHGQDGYERAGRFKKASNMNFCLNVSLRADKMMEDRVYSDLETVKDDYEIYSQVLQELCETDPAVWAAGNIRIGEYILLVDSDTRVPEDCLMDAANEMTASPEVAVLQHLSGVMNVTHTFWENMISWFTELVYHSIKLATANGDLAPFVGHNAFLRWSALQEATSSNNENFMMFWSENHVSEDFELSLRFLDLGYDVRYAAYARGEFKEGVSLTVYDELSRWRKYAFGSSELLFHPLRYWLTRGPITPIFRRLVRSSIPSSAKWSLFAYMGTYVALASAWIIVLVNYGVKSFYSQHVDHMYVSSWEILLSTLVVFGAFGPLAYVLARFRMGDESLRGVFGNTVKYIIPLTMFFTAVSFHCSMAILSHFFSVRNVQWTSTAKELTKTNFFVEMRILLRSYRSMYIILTLLIIGTAISQTSVLPYHWVVTNFTAVFPVYWTYGCHLLVPFVFNPQLIMFKF